VRYEAYGVIVYTRNALAITRAIQSHILFAKRREPSRCNNTARLDTCVLAIGSHICARVRTRVRVYEHMTCVLAIGSHTYIYIYTCTRVRTRVCACALLCFFQHLVYTPKENWHCPATTNRCKASPRAHSGLNACKIRPYSSHVAFRAKKCTRESATPGESMRTCVNVRSRKFAWYSASSFLLH
jgi:hypothetical protein